jgi:hypothetical protein
MNDDRAEPHWELRFVSLFDSGRGWGFPCDADGHVDLDSLSERGRTNYFYARTLIGRDVAMPAVHACSGPCCTPAADAPAARPAPCAPAVLQSGRSAACAAT